MIFACSRACDPKTTTIAADQQVLKMSFMAVIVVAVVGGGAAAAAAAGVAISLFSTDSNHGQPTNCSGDTFFFHLFFLFLPRMYRRTHMHLTLLKQTHNDSKEEEEEEAAASLCLAHIFHLNTVAAAAAACCPVAVPVFARPAT